MSEREPLVERLDDYYAEHIEPVLDRAAELMAGQITETSTREMAQLCRSMKGHIDEIEAIVKEAAIPWKAKIEECQNAKKALIEPLDKAVGEMLQKIQIGSMLPHAEGITQRNLKKWELIDPNLVPSQFQSPDAKKISEFIKSTSGAVPIPGVRIWEETIQVVSRPDKE